MPFDDKVIKTLGELRMSLFAKGTPIGPYDMQIAAIALSYGLTVVTHNVREFERVPDLKDYSVPKRFIEPEISTV